VLATYPFPKSTLTKWNRGDYANLTAVVDLTLSRLDSSFFTGTRFEGISRSWNSNGDGPSVNCPAPTPQRIRSWCPTSSIRDPKVHLSKRSSSRWLSSSWGL
jgi:ABC-type transporter Mla subunit MlaD